ncbi:MAG: hypothetical protein KC420_05485 [Myxococcales bacterium]|nr:hypothetical protein [Myxococcales bacterium]
MGARGGRPSKATSDRLDRLVALLRAGNYRKTAAAAVGISPRTLNGWLRDGRANYEAAQVDPSKLDEFGLFYELVIQAEAEAEVGAVRGVIELAYKKGDGGLLLKFLERRYPDRWGRRSLDVSVSTADAAAEAEARREELREKIERAIASFGGRPSVEEVH